MNESRDLKSYFEQKCDGYSSYPALHMADADITYDALNRRANRFAHFLMSLGCRPGDVIAIISDKSIDNYAMMIAALKIGVAYTNIDDDNPIERNESIFRTCSPKAVFSVQKESAMATLCQDMDIAFHEFEAALSDNENNPDTIVTGEAIAYIMFTSGSTGTPKGVSIRHDSVVNFITWTKTRYWIEPQDNFAQLSPLYFDNSVFDFYGALFNGASLTPVTKNVLSDPLALTDYVDQKECTIWFSVPSLLIYLLSMRVLTADRLKHIRVFTFGGEGFPKTELKKLYELYHDRAVFINVYGPTEGTCICSSYTIAPDEFDDISALPSLGTINPRFFYRILNKGEEKEEGELVIYGPNIATGYYNDPERTASAFTTYDGHRAYHTGDLVREENGLLYFRGRADNQIKHMGYRIELEEIEFALNSLNCIKQAAVIYHREKTAYGKIIAFIVSEEQNETLDVEYVTKLLADKIPAYMHPHSYKILSQFPKNKNGKIDKIQLKDMI